MQNEPSVTTYTAEGGPFVEFTPATWVQAYPDSGVAWPLGYQRVWHNDAYVVFSYEEATVVGVVQRLAVVRKDSATVRSWRDMQAIKDELAGPSRTAIEVFPPAGEVIDEINAYHLWVLPPGFLLPVDLHGWKRRHDPRSSPAPGGLAKAHRRRRAREVLRY